MVSIEGGAVAKWSKAVLGGGDKGDPGFAPRPGPGKL